MDFCQRFGEIDISKKFVMIAGGLAVTAASIVVLKKLLRREVKVYPRDTVILHQIGRGPYVPSYSPFPVKIETYLRMAGIPYQNVHDFTRSSKGKIPWIEYNGEPVADTSIAIQFLNTKLGVDVNQHLSSAEKAVALSMKILAEDHLFWCLALFRWVYNKDNSQHKLAKISPFKARILRHFVSKFAWGQGLGRHSREEVVNFLKQDLQALSDFLGTKSFLMGEQACEADCSVFAMLSQLYLHSLASDNQTLMKDEYPSLAAYCERMKTRFWPDWDECITHGGTRKATK